MQELLYYYTIIQKKVIGENYIGETIYILFDVLMVKGTGGGRELFLSSFR